MQITLFVYCLHFPCKTETRSQLFGVVYIGAQKVMQTVMIDVNRNTVSVLFNLREM